MKKILFLLALIGLFCSLTAKADDSGKCGDWDSDLTWTYVEATQTLTISGNGSMKNYDNRVDNSFSSHYDYRPPWLQNSHIIQNVIIKSGVTSVGTYAFMLCNDLKSIVLPEGVTQIGNYAFWGCSNLTSISIPNSVTSIGDQAFETTAWYNNQPDGLVYAEQVAYKYKGEMPSDSRITIREGTKVIADKAFYQCGNLTSISIPESVVSIGNQAFEGTEWFNNQQDGLVYAGSVAYRYKGYMQNNTKIAIKPGTTGIAKGAFQNCNGLIAITIPGSLKYIGIDAFENSNLKSIYISDLTAWCSAEFPYLISYGDGYSLFVNGEELQDLVIPTGVKAIGNYTFSNIKELHSVTIPDGVTSIGNSAFCKNKSLQSVTIPEGVVSIGNYAFGSCLKLNSINIPSTTTYIGTIAFSGCSSLPSIIIPNSVKTIGSGAFAYCENLNSIKIPEGITCIGEGMFSDCSRLSSITIPSSIVSIGDRAFSCGVTNFFCFAKPVPSTSLNAFSNWIINNATLHVPAESLEDYVYSEPWSSFGSIVAINDIIEQCSKPTIYYANGKIKFYSETEGVVFNSRIIDTDISSYLNSKINLTVAYTIKVYATREGYRDSEAATATLCWIDVDPQKEGITNDEVMVSEIKAMPVLIQSDGNMLTVNGAPAGTPIYVYDLSGRLIGNATAVEGMTSIQTTTSEKVVIVKVGKRSVKVALK